MCSKQLSHVTSYPYIRQTPNANCSITYGPSPNNCSLMSNSTTATPNRSSSLYLGRLDAEEYCYTVELNHGSTVLSIKGIFRSRETVVMLVAPSIFYLHNYIECDPEVLGTDPSPQRIFGSVTVPNGVINYNGSAPGSVTTLACDQGYSVMNDINRTCMTDGHWSDETLQCIKDRTVTPGMSV